MTKRCIMIFPQFSNQSVIDEIRNKYDPLAALVAPHITLVFPFISGLTTEMLRTHIERVLGGIKPFRLGMKNIVPVKAGGNYLFLTVTEGREEIKVLHRQLYSGVLERFKSKEYTYKPHLTVGLIEDEKAYAKAIEEVSAIDEEFYCDVDTVRVEVIGENEESIIEMEYRLGRNDYGKGNCNCDSSGSRWW